MNDSVYYIIQMGLLLLAGANWLITTQYNAEIRTYNASVNYFGISSVLTEFYGNLAVLAV